MNKVHALLSPAPTTIYMQAASNNSGIQQSHASVTTRELRVLVVVACYGIKNLGFLKQIIDSYRRMDFHVDITVVSEAPKPLGGDVNVIVGLPTNNPWTLPFAHKKVFADHLEDYDLFIYTEDDIEIREDQVRAFLWLVPQLEPGEIPGYVRYETDEAGVRILTDIHGSFHWKAESVRQRGAHTIAELTNEHAGFYILTQDQLRRAITSGDFLRAPYEGRYGLPETAATDPYTCCGFRKVVCISAFDDFLIRHMSNLYVKRHGMSVGVCRDQIQTMLRSARREHPALSLCEVEPKVLQRKLSKSYYEKPVRQLLNLVPETAKKVLSVGAGWGAIEMALKERGAAITALPLDSVVGPALGEQGIEAVYTTLDDGPERLGSRRFDCVLITNLLHLLPHPEAVLVRYARLLEPGGSMVLSGPNLCYLPIMLRRVFRAAEYRTLGSFAASGINVFCQIKLKRWLVAAGLQVGSWVWLPSDTGRSFTRRVWQGAHALGAESWALHAQAVGRC
jgi:hypothetical protein